MKRIAIVFICILFASTVFASGGRPHKPSNWDIFGSDDRQNKHGEQTTPVPVPEPLTGYLLAAGLVGLAAWARRR